VIKETATEAITDLRKGGGELDINLLENCLVAMMTVFIWMILKLHGCTGLREIPIHLAKLLLILLIQNKAK
jgi:hypothetical protein